MRSTLPTKLPCVGWSSNTIGAPELGVFLTITLTLNFANLSSSFLFIRDKSCERGSSSDPTVGFSSAGINSSIFSKMFFWIDFKNSVAGLYCLYFLRSSSTGELIIFLASFSRRRSISSRCFSSHCGRSCAVFSISACMAFKSLVIFCFSSSLSWSNASGLKTSPSLTGATTNPTGICNKDTLLPLAFFCKILM